MYVLIGGIDAPGRSRLFEKLTTTRRASGKGGEISLFFRS